MHARILIVEDEEDAAGILADFFEGVGCTVRVAHDGFTALQVVTTFAPDVALVDIGLPVMDGYELARRLRRVPGLSCLHAIAVTGYDEAWARLSTRAAEFDAFVAKPVDLERLCALLRAPRGKLLENAC